jgi:hypothetical protein
MKSRSGSSGVHIRFNAHEAVVPRALGDMVHNLGA